MSCENIKDINIDKYFFFTPHKCPMINNSIDKLYNFFNDKQETLSAKC